MYNTAEITCNHQNILMFADKEIKYFGSNDKNNLIELLSFSVLSLILIIQYILFFFKSFFLVRRKVIWWFFIFCTFYEYWKLISLLFESLKKSGNSADILFKHCNFTIKCQSWIRLKISFFEDWFGSVGILNGYYLKASF